VLGFWEAGRVGDLAQEPLRAVAGEAQAEDSAAV